MAGAAAGPAPPRLQEGAERRRSRGVPAGSVHRALLLAGGRAPRCGRAGAGSGPRRCGPVPGGSRGSCSGAERSPFRPGLRGAGLSGGLLDPVRYGTVRGSALPCRAAPDRRTGRRPAPRGGLRASPVSQRCPELVPGLSPGRGGSSAGPRAGRQRSCLRSPGPSPAVTCCPGRPHGPAGGSTGGFLCPQLVQPRRELGGRTELGEGSPAETVVGWIGSLGVAGWLRGLPEPIGNGGRVGAAGIGPAVDIRSNSLTHRGSEQLLPLLPRGFSSSLGRSHSFSFSVWKRSDFPGSFLLQQQVGLSRSLLLAPGRCTKNTQKMQEELLLCGCQMGEVLRWLLGALGPASCCHQPRGSALPGAVTAALARAWGRAALLTGAATNALSWKPEG